eukprot:GHVT01072580.1.p1 GENE.GHVT01072580.1~~GHVT01072580.1.p1  ORF type:complete len:141 (+),score=31.92 GHVT01072580.1:175-597(+)
MASLASDSAAAAPTGGAAAAPFDKNVLNGRPLNMCELHLILADQQRMAARRLPEAQALIRQSYEYAMRFTKLKSRNAIIDIRVFLEHEGEVNEHEVALLVNLQPRSVDEARSLIPSLVRLPEQTLFGIVESLESYRVYAG